MAFDDILGNKRAKSILAKSLQRKRLPNSLLFFGPEGVGKGEAALVVAKALNCLKKNDDACEECPSCRAINRQNFPDVMIFKPENDGHKIEQMRILKQSAYLRPMVGKKRVFIIFEADKMRDDASNSLLKILEEPPPFSFIFLLTSNPDMILPTIRSRCLLLQFTPVFKEEIEKTLVERGQDVRRARIVSHLVDGSLKQAIGLDWDELEKKRKKGWELFLSLLKKEKVSFSFREWITQRFQDKREVEETFEILSTFCRDALLIKGGGDDRYLLNLDYRNKMMDATAGIGFDETLDLMGRIDYHLYALKKNCNVRLLLSSFFSHCLRHDHV
jgi:DNA polymerase-3 subunit delta'